MDQLDGPGQTLSYSRRCRRQTGHARHSPWARYYYSLPNPPALCVYLHGRKNSWLRYSRLSWFMVGMGQPARHPCGGFLSLMDALFICLQKVAPQKLLSRMAGVFAESRLGWWKNLFIRRFVNK